ncbi:Translocation protein sec63 [Golovinomyces cichoracearum]|uniref:Translocation protein sec63 n=1 Tax=Golovinomyces cichoracearum TaxID=62708 RepID=A0A420IT32_9PEZI|nr:Translocation protein sec63 [Golovinomyces cichoracearum]
MSGTDYSYDDEGQFFPFFFLTVTAIITIPLTYSLLKPSSEDAAKKPKLKTDFVPKHAELIDDLRNVQKRRELKIKRICTVIIGWIAILGMVYLILITSRTVSKIWNPYDILKISESATEKQIKSHYRRMSLKFHPDKVRPDPRKNETVQSLNDYFVELTKAYKALTDEEIRNNYIQFGHPDGKQSYSIGIALPKIIIAEGNGKYVLIIYATLLGVLLPYLVGSWWYGTQRMSKENILIESANKLFREFQENITIGELLRALSTGVEFRTLLKDKKVISRFESLESKILSVDEAEGEEAYACGMSKKNRLELEAMEVDAPRKALGLLWAYLGRVDLGDAVLDRKKFEVAPIAYSLNTSFTVISFAFGSTTPVLNSYLTTQSLMQAIPPGGSPLLQLPYFTKKLTNLIDGSSKNHLTIQDYMKLPRHYRRKISIGKGLLTIPQYKVAVTFARQMPYLQIEKTFFKVTGEKFVTSNSLVTLVIKSRVIPPGSSNVPEIDEVDLEDTDSDVEDLDTSLERKKPNEKNGKAINQMKSFQPPLTHSPYFSRDYSPKWHVFLADSKQRKIAVPPFTFTSFDKPIFDDNGKPTFNVQTFKAQFQSPPHAGQYKFTMHMICDSYIGFDSKMDILLTVEDSSKIVEVQEEDDISEPDEDSIAGQMHALKTGGLSSSTKKKRISKEHTKDSSDGESDSDEETLDEAGDTSETNTDTDED